MSRDLIGKGAIVLLALPALLLPALVLGYIAHKGVAAVSWQFLFDTSQGIGAQLSGSLLLALGACLLAAPLALGTALYHRLLASPRQRRLLDLLLQMLQGIPPIVFGLCGLVVFVHLLQWGVSLASGAVVLAMVILPMLVLNTIAALARIPAEYGEAAQSLGLGHGAIIGRVWLRLAWRPLVTGLLLGTARALSETAPILFTATVFSGVVWPASIFEPVTTLQTHIFYLAQEGSDPRAIQTAWGSALVLIAVVAACGLAARLLRKVGYT